MHDTDDATQSETSIGWGKTAVFLLALTTAVGMAGVASANDDTKQAEAKALDDHECDETEWHFVITGIDDPEDAPDTIHVTWSNDEEADVPLDRVTGKVAHYTTTLHLDASVTDATAEIGEDWDGQFNLSHGPCDGPGEEEVPCPTLTASAEAGPSNHLEWTEVDDADSYEIHRGVGDGDLELLATVGSDTLSFDDTDVEQGETYRYTVIAIVDDEASEACNVVEVTAIPVFPTALAAASAGLLGIGAYALARRRV